MPVVWPCRCSYSKYDNSCSFHGFSYLKAGSPGIEVYKPEDRRGIGWDGGKISREQQ